MIRSRVVALLVFGSLLLAVAGQGASQVRYVDEKGVVHFVQSHDLVPKEFRDQATGRSIAPRTDADRARIAREDRERAASAAGAARRMDKMLEADRQRLKDEKEARREAEIVKQAEHQCAKNEAADIGGGMGSRRTRLQCEEFYKAGGRALWHPELESAGGR